MPRETQPYHWFVSSALYWKTGTNLRLILNELKKQHGRGKKNMETSFAIWRVPLDVGTTYSIAFYAPQVEGSVLCGYVDASEGIEVQVEEEDIASGA